MRELASSIHRRRGRIQSIVKADHEIIFSGIENFRKSFKGLRSPGSSRDFVATRRLIAEKVVAHVNLEETRLFPEWLADNPTEKETQGIAELLREHEMLLKRLEQLIPLRDQRNPPDCTEQFWRAMMDFFIEMERHCENEESLLEASGQATQPPRRTTLLQAAQARHESIFPVIENLRSLVKGGDSPDVAKEFLATQHLFNEMLADHFAYEETHLFPALMAGNPPEETMQAIAKLRQEHAPLLQQARQLSVPVELSSLRECRNELLRAIANFVIALENHAAKEDRLFKTLSA